jgi:hypothetical protein
MPVMSVLMSCDQVALDRAPTEEPATVLAYKVEITLAHKHQETAQRAKELQACRGFLCVAIYRL